MREIKFRAWVLRDWALDGLMDNMMEYDVESFHDPLYEYKQGNIILMQYTGLKDKNDKEIYEGDILECHHKIKGNVFFHDGSYGISSEECELNVEDIHTYDNLNVELINDNDLVVIGNIYENPELLEESK